MSNLEIQERFSLEAPPEETWRFLIDPNRVVNCLPGAELLGQTDEITYRGAVRVKIGAVTVAYSGVVVFELSNRVVAWQAPHGPLAQVVRGSRPLVVLDDPN